ncbi:MAG TPA: antibiotic biosynthesis monooxygenase [Paraburkholderia sp.]|jgi:heme-degrading monooxygenase HmoA|nr:antibiotic biosynthesis monooxygenase [Paraburkholderia sp.]
MKLVIVQHYLQPDAEETALARIDALTERMRVQPGFCFRHVGRESNDPSCIVSVTAWNTAEDCARWEADLAAAPLPKIDRSRLYRSAEHMVVDTTTIGM